MHKVIQITERRDWWEGHLLPTIHDGKLLDQLDLRRFHLTMI